MIVTAQKVIIHLFSHRSGLWARLRLSMLPREGRHLPWYRMKVVTKVPGNAVETQRRRELVRPLIATHGGKDVSPARPGAKFTAAVFSTAKAAKAFRDSARQSLR
jgi:hypothetical protein